MKNSYFLIFIFSVLIILGLIISFLPSSTSPVPQNQSLDKVQNFNIETLNGTIIDLSNFKNDYLILDFFATWCVPCESQAHLLGRFLVGHPDVTIISISVDGSDSIEKLIEYKNITEITWLVGRDKDLRANELFGTYQLPTIAYFNPEGDLIHLKHNLVTYTELEGWLGDNVAQTENFYVFGFEISSAIGLPLFFIIGLYVALSPCLFPIMPITIIQVLRKQNELELNSELKESSSPDDQNLQLKPNNRGKTVFWIVTLWAGILFSFGIFSLIGVIIGFILIQYYLILNLLFGTILIAFGMIILVPSIEEKVFSGLPIPERIQKILNKDLYWSYDLFVIGVVYSFIALPCSGPIFIALIPLLINYSNPLLSFLSLFVFAIGLLLPYLILISIASETQTLFVKGIRNRYILLKNITAILLIFVGGVLAWPFFDGPILFGLA